MIQQSANQRFLKNTVAKAAAERTNSLLMLKISCFQNAEAGDFFRRTFMEAAIELIYYSIQSFTVNALPRTELRSVAESIR